VVTVSAFVSVHCVPWFALHDMPHAHRGSHGKLRWGTVTSWVPLMLCKDADLHYFMNHKQDGKVLHVEQEVLFFVFFLPEYLLYFPVGMMKLKVCKIFTISKETLSYAVRNSVTYI
jgi:hypothetical protein